MKKINEITTAAAIKLDAFERRLQRKLQDNKGEFAMNNGVAFVLIVALAAVLLTALIAYFKGDFSESVKSNISNLFSQS